MLKSPPYFIDWRIWSSQLHKFCSAFPTNYKYKYRSTLILFDQIFCWNKNSLLIFPLANLLWAFTSCLYVIYFLPSSWSFFPSYCWLLLTSFKWTCLKIFLEALDLSWYTLISSFFPISDLSTELSLLESYHSSTILFLTSKLTSFVFVRHVGFTAFRRKMTKKPHVKLLVCGLKIKYQTCKYYF